MTAIEDTAASQVAKKDRTIEMLRHELAAAQVNAARYLVLRDELQNMTAPPILVISGANSRGHATEHLAEDELDEAVDKIRAVVDAREQALNAELATTSSKQRVREEAADHAYLNYDLGDAEVVDDDGWEYVEPGNEWTRKIYLAPEAGDDEPGNSMRLTFTVRFNDDDTVAEAYAIDTCGQIHGAISQTEPKDR